MNKIAETRPPKKKYKAGRFIPGVRKAVIRSGKVLAQAGGTPPDEVKIKMMARQGGLVDYYVYGPSETTLARNFTPSKVIHVLENGLPIRELTSLQTGFDIPMERLAPLLGMSKATVHRLKVGGKRLGPAESDRVVRFARLLGKAIQVFGDEEDARQWLGSPQFGLGNAIPLDYARSEIGAREVENLLGRIEFGVYS